MNAEAQESADLLQQEQQKFKDLHQLPKAIKDAVQVNKSLTEKMRRTKQTELSR